MNILIAQSLAPNNRVSIFECQSLLTDHNCMDDIAPIISWIGLLTIWDDCLSEQITLRLNLKTVLILWDCSIYFDFLFLVDFNTRKVCVYFSQKLYIFKLLYKL